MQSVEHIAHTALALAGVPADRQRGIVDDVLERLDRPEAIRRRDYWLREAFGLVGSVRILTEAMVEFQIRHWPALRHLAAPPAHLTPLRAALFNVCQASDDAGADIPGERQVRRIVS